MTDTANAREIIDAVIVQCDGEDTTMLAPAIIAALAAHGLEIRPTAPPAGKDVGEDELVDIAYEAMGMYDGNGETRRRVAIAVAAIRVPLIQQGLREAAEIGTALAATLRERLGDKATCAVVVDDLVAIYEARIDAMGKEEE